MANLKEIRNRITSVGSTRQITSAMKMVSAAKLRKAQDAIVQLRPYARKLQDIMAAVSESIQDDEDNIYSVVRDPEKILIVVITSNRGLCGGFNANVIKRAVQVAAEEYGPQLARDNVHFYMIGKKGDDFFRKRKLHIEAVRNDIYANLNYESVAEISNGIMNQFLNKDFDKVILVYNQFRNAAVQDLVAEQFLPLKPKKKEEDQDFRRTYYNYIFEPSREYIVKELIPRSLRLQFYKALLDSHASEHGARMTAMHKATDNATELIKSLTLDYNKARQASITNEILEIVSGANALEG
jgi:F-type H+-transporting ATPase subunit gamma